MAILSALMLTRERGELLGFRADELVVGSRARAALGEFLGESFGEPFAESAETFSKWSYSSYLQSHIHMQKV